MNDSIVIIVEGVDASGKSTLIPGLVEWLSARRKRPVQSFRDPGSTPLGERIRALVKNAAEPMEQSTSFLLFCAARSELAAKVNKHLAAGEDVVLDRWWFSTYAYQGTLGIDKGLIREVATQTARIDAHWTAAFYLDVSDDVARQRLAADVERRSSTAIKDRFESMGADFRAKLRERYNDLCLRGKLERVDTDKLTPHDVFNEVTSRLIARRV